jgi:hAT family C-terminal dimerisation region
VCSVQVGQLTSGSGSGNSRQDEHSPTPNTSTADETQRPSNPLISAGPDVSTVSLQPQHKRFKLLLQDWQSRAAASASVVSLATASIDNELDKYLHYVSTLTDMGSECGLGFWLQWREAEQLNPYPLLTPLAQNLISAPASQAYSERVFSLCGNLTARKRNRMSVNLEKRTFLKMNKGYL